MVKILAYPLTIIYLIIFGLTLVIFHPIQWLCLNLFGYQAHKKSVDYLNWCLIRCLHVLGVRYQFENSHNIPTARPIIIVTNHQSMNDIPPIIWFMRKHHPKFISKKELGKGFPSVSFNLRHGGSVLIDRKDVLGSIKAIEEFAKRVQCNNWAAVIFPEGTRSRDGKPKPFKTKGLMTLIENIPDGLVVPMSINNSWKTLKYGKFPMGLGAKITFKVHDPIEIGSHDPKDLINRTEQIIKEHLHAS